MAAAISASLAALGSVCRFLHVLVGAVVCRFVLLSLFCFYASLFAVMACCLFLFVVLLVVVLFACFICYVVVFMLISLAAFRFAKFSFDWASVLVASARSRCISSLISERRPKILPLREL